MNNMTSKSMVVSGIGISYVDSGGEGLPLVMLHGSGASKEVFSMQFAAAVLRQYRMIALDLPGHGQSENAIAPSTYTFSGLAQVVVEVLKQLDVHAPIILGWSLGGHVAIDIAAGGHQTKGLILCGTPPLSRGPFSFLSAFQPKLDMLLSTKPVFSQIDAQRFSELIYGAAIDAQKIRLVERSDGNSRKYIAKSIFRGEVNDQRRFIESTDVPIAIVNGQQDPLLRLKYFKYIRLMNLWKGRCLEIEGAGHASFIEAPEKFNALLAEFIHEMSFHKSKYFSTPSKRVA